MRNCIVTIFSGTDFHYSDFIIMHQGRRRHTEQHQWKERGYNPSKFNGKNPAQKSFKHILIKRAPRKAGHRRFIFFNVWRWWEHGDAGLTGLFFLSLSWEASTVQGPITISYITVTSPGSGCVNLRASRGGLHPSSLHLSHICLFQDKDMCNLMGVKDTPIDMFKGPVPPRYTNIDSIHSWKTSSSSRFKLTSSAEGVRWPLSHPAANKLS